MRRSWAVWPPRRATVWRTSDGSRQLAGVPVRPVTVLDANALVPPGLRDLLLICASGRVFRAVWHTEVEAELRRNGARLLTRRSARHQRNANPSVGVVAPNLVERLQQRASHGQNVSSPSSSRGTH